MCDNESTIGEEDNGKPPHEIHYPRENSELRLWFLLRSKSSMQRSFVIRLTLCKLESSSVTLLSTILITFHVAPWEKLPTSPDRVPHKPIWQLVAFTWAIFQTETKKSTLAQQVLVLLANFVPQTKQFSFIALKKDNAIWNWSLSTGANIKEVTKATKTVYLVLSCFILTPSHHTLRKMSLIRAWRRWIDKAITE